MEIFDAMDASLVVNDDDNIFNFTFQGQQEDEFSDTTTFSCENGGFFPELMEEDLEWLSNKDAFPSVETCFGILSDNPQLTSNLHSPISVLENNDDKNSNSITLSCCESLKVPTKHPVRARSKRILRRRTNFGDLTNHQCLILNQVKVENGISPLPKTKNSGASIGRRCLHCQSDKTPQWRAGPMGPKTLCNACGVRYKSGRLVPEYRPVNSPTFSSDLHSNSHKKVVEMRKKKHQAMGF